VNVNYRCVGPRLAQRVVYVTARQPPQGNRLAATAVYLVNGSVTPSPFVTLFLNPSDAFPRGSYPKLKLTRMWVNAQRDGRPSEYRWRPLFNAAKFGLRPQLEYRAVTLPRRETH